ncbi:Holliday junction resolvase-like protein [Mucilaginibacter sp.]|uniref:Holliday junction resolvase-like protein n=1 Tax=Mucilaginibacter sp. TaxID=1882438 RepID=UPI003B00107A
MILLDVTISTGWLITIGIVILILLYNLFETSRDSDKAKQMLREMDLKMKAKEAELKVSYQNWAIEELDRFKQAEIEKVQKHAEQQYREAALVLLQKWKIEEEAKIRQDAINRSYSVNLGKITEHLVPFHSSFLSQFNPKDARFIGSPIDLIVFDGYADKKDDIIIYIVEVKTGNSRLTEIQQKIKAAVLKGEIRWAEINPDNSSFIQVSTSNITDKITNQLPLKL